MQCSGEHEPIPARKKKGIDYHDRARPPRTWKHYRKTKYHRITGLSHKQVMRILDFERRFSKAGL